jgi:hypothetical protein
MANPLSIEESIKRLASVVKARLSSAKKQRVVDRRANVKALV